MLRTRLLKRRILKRVGAGLLGLVAALARAGDGGVLADEHVVPVEGFVADEVLSLPLGAFVGGLEHAPDGSLILYDSGSGEVRRLAEAGVVILARFDPPVFGSFLTLDPDGQAVWFGESSEHRIYRLPLAGSAGALPAPVDRVTFNFDLALDGGGRGLISAPGSAGNGLFLLDRDPQSPDLELITGLGAASGPLAFDSEGNLYYGTYDPAGTVGESILRFPRDLIDNAIAGGSIDRSAGDIVIDELPGIYGLLWHEDHIYFTDLGFSNNQGALYGIDLRDRVLLVRAIATFSTPEVGLLSPSFLSFLPGPRGFQPGAGREGGELVVAYSDFQTVNAISAIFPERHFVRGRVNDDGAVDMSDAVALFGFLFLGGRSPDPPDAGDVNADGALDLADGIFLLDYLFRGGPVIPAPFPDPGPAR